MIVFLVVFVTGLLAGAGCTLFVLVAVDSRRLGAVRRPLTTAARHGARHQVFRVTPPPVPATGRASLERGARR